MTATAGLEVQLPARRYPLVLQMAGARHLLPKTQFIERQCARSTCVLDGQRRPDSDLRFGPWAEIRRPTPHSSAMVSAGDMKQV